MMISLFFILGYLTIFFLTRGSPLDYMFRVRLGVAECRANCLARYPGECVEGGDCFMCWDVCRLVGSDADTWSNMCHKERICFSGCQTARNFYQNQNGNRRPNRRQHQFRKKPRLIFISSINRLLPQLGLPWTLLRPAPPMPTSIWELFRG